MCAEKTAPLNKVPTPVFVTTTKSPTFVQCQPKNRDSKSSAPIPIKTFFYSIFFLIGTCKRRKRRHPSKICNDVKKAFTKEKHFSE